MKRIEKCNHRGCDEMIMKVRVIGHAYFARKINGEEADNTELHDYIEHKDIWKYPRCAECGKRVVLP